MAEDFLLRGMDLLQFHCGRWLEFADACGWDFKFSCETLLAREFRELRYENVGLDDLVDIHVEESCSVTNVARENEFIVEVNAGSDEFLPDLKSGEDEVEDTDEGVGCARDDCYVGENVVEVDIMEAGRFRCCQTRIGF